MSERITGGRAGNRQLPYHFRFRLQVEVRNITVHGREAATDVPLAHADNVIGPL